MSTSFKIYSASAGSGKTYTLAKSYIKLLIASKSSENFRNILAITFTNKAVGEMKTRIIDMLKLFSSDENLENEHAMFRDICEELNIEAKALQQKSKLVLDKIIHNYGAFDISTIDGFTHRVIRTFAFDLDLPVNFEVELDQDYLLTKAVDALIAKAGTDKTLTKTLVDFAIEKADDDKSWDIGEDFKKIGKLVLNENDIPYINKLKDKTLDDFKALKKALTIKIKKVETESVLAAEKALSLIENKNIPFNHFSYSDLPNHFLKMKSLKLHDLKFDGRLSKNLEAEKYYGGKATTETKQNIDEIIETLKSLYQSSKALVDDYLLPKAIYKNITPLSVINVLQKELQQLKQDENKLLISEFNTLISDEIKDQPTPFIYERLGEKFKHYFVDEFQDTSTMQWQNINKLMDNAMSAYGGTTMLVGDAKQSIYRWRGGDAEQFIDLFQGQKNPFQVKADVENLASNFRSYKQVVEFNNSFFSFISNQFFKNEAYKSLYKNATQKLEKDKEGYVNLQFLEFEGSEERFKNYTEKTCQTVKSCLDNGYKPKDICVLVRKKKEGIAVSDYLTSNDINIVSSETLLLNNSEKVKLLNSVFALLVNPEDEKLKLEMLVLISKVFKFEDKHSFFQHNLKIETDAIFDGLKSFNIHINSENLLQMPIYELAESLVRGFNLCENETDAYVQFYLDTVLDFSNKQTSDISGFLEYYESKKEKLSIAMPEDLDAVSIMTIHKSKGLEFPVVIFPFADLDIYRQIEPKNWFPLNKEDYNDFDNALINYNTEVENFGEIGAEIYNTKQSELELDGINLLYVTLTRAVEQLYIITKKDISKKGVINPKTYAGMFINYLISENLWHEEKAEYSYGKPIKKSKDGFDENTIQDYVFISTPKESHNLKVITNSGILWETEQEKAIEYGNLVHLVMSKIYTKNDVEAAIASVVGSGQIKQSDVSALQKIITAIVEHEKLSEYFTENYTIYNERDILSKNGLFLRPDRLVIKDKNAIIIDYKTGNEDKKHNSQLESYAVVLREMNYETEKKLIVYTNDTIKIVEVK